ncbi:G patch domain-containing protein 4 [Geranomyces variabilis]|uniref:G patch domain-containing protein 4 n=1 Tax=Geranomyces variabilis TaxID=109894 RepID=A0AAD5TN04_9FUNG|nr:G patch domain-containing protein 4 [Geranomyces variabilis]
MPSYTDADEDVRVGMGGDSNFAQTQLAKYGWEKGTGLGKHRDGINKAISVGFKNDTDGLGAKSDEWSFAWWDHVFNKSAASIKIHKDSDNDDAVAVSASAADSQQAAKKLLYGTFVKATPADEAIVERKDYSIKVTDEELFLACEGRTARKGARSSQPGKLARAGLSPAAVAEAMEAVAAVAVTERTPKEEKRARKEQRAARRAEKAARRERRAARKAQAAAALLPSEPIDLRPPAVAEGQEKKKAKKAKKNKAEQAEQTVEAPAEEASITEPSVEKKQKRKEKKVAAEPIAAPEAAAGKKEKKRKRKGGDDADEPPKKSR